jgi:hypothetical protein
MMWRAMGMHYRRHYRRNEGESCRVAQSAGVRPLREGETCGAPQDERRGATVDVCCYPNKNGTSDPAVAPQASVQITLVGP